MPLCCAAVYVRPDVKCVLIMGHHSFPKHLLVEFVERFALFVTEGKRGVMAASIGRSAYDRWLLKRKWKQGHETLCRLRNQGFLHISNRGDRFIATLTDKGRVAILRNRICTKSKRLPEGRLCLISFDFPERIRRSRGVFRQLLCEAKFERKHQSTWVSNRDVTHEFVDLVRMLGAEEWIHIYHAVRIRKKNQ